MTEFLAFLHTIIVVLLQVRAAYTQLFRIHLLTEQADFGKAHTYICEAVALSSNSSEHYDMMKFAHKLLSVFAVGMGCMYVCLCVYVCIYVCTSIPLRP